MRVWPNFSFSKEELYFKLNKTTYQEDDLRIPYEGYGGRQLAFIPSGVIAGQLVCILDQSESRYSPVCYL